MIAAIRFFALVAAPLLSHISVAMQLPLLRVVAVLLLLLALLANQLGKALTWLGFVAVAALLLKVPAIALAVSAAFPALLMAATASVFARSLLPEKTPLVAAMAAAIRNETLPQKIADYCRAVTYLWAITLFAMALLNIGLALFASAETWSLVANIANYAIVAMLFAVEFVVRSLWLREFEHPSAIEFAQGLRRLNYRELLQ